MAEKNKKQKGFIWLIGVSMVAVGLLLFCQFYFGNGVDENTKFYENTSVNGIDVSNLTISQAENVVSSGMLSERDEIDLKLKFEDKVFTLKGNDFEGVDDLHTPLANAIGYGKEGNIFQKYKIGKKIKKEGYQIKVSYVSVLGGLKGKLDEIADELDRDAKTSSVIFSPDSDEMFEILPAENGVKVEREKLYSEIERALVDNKSAEIEIPFEPIVPKENKDALIENIALRSRFSSSIASSSKDRKLNIDKALSSFNGLIVERAQKISFNDVTGPRNEENGYKSANIILNGVYVKGAGGGVCQASTTLYNALVLAGVDIKEVAHHSLPASYVPLSLDAMVSEGVSDLVFENNLDSPIYIKACTTDTEAIVEIYGQPYEEGVTMETQIELVKIIPHAGDKLVKDVSGQYSDKVLYEGEYYRIKYPREGYESKAYLVKKVNGEEVNKKEIRHDFYWPQDGVVVEGAAKLGQGMTLQKSDVKLIPPQHVTEENLETIKARLEKQSPSMYNP